MSPAAPTVRSLARLLNLSRSTISAALRGDRLVAPATALRVRQAAEKTGYRHNPLAATLMSELRRSRGGTFRGVLATVELHEGDRPGGHGPFHGELRRGAQAGAGKLGFKLEHFVIGRNDLTLPRLDTILHSRGIHGLLLLPAWHMPDYSALSWDRFSGAYTDYNLMQPALHSVCSDHYRSMMLTLERLHALGYHRPGLFIEHGRNERLHRRLAAAFQAYYEDYITPGRIPVPPLVSPELSRVAFNQWFQRHQPDVVLSHFTDVLDWMAECGARVPETHGFVCLNSVQKTRPCAALDLQPAEIGTRGVELVVAQLHRNELGIPTSPTRTTIPSRWVDGPTVRR